MDNNLTVNLQGFNLFFILECYDGIVKIIKF